MRFSWIVAALWLMAASLGLHNAAFAGDGAASTSVMRPVVLKRAVFGLKDGEIWATYSNARLCGLLKYDVRWRAEDSELNVSRFASVFDDELVRAGLKSSTPESLFDDRTTAGGLQIGLLIKDMKGAFCTLSTDGSDRTRSYRGTIDMTVEWQVFDPTRREIIATLETVARGEARDREREGLERAIFDAFRQSARTLVAKDEFRRLVMAAPEPVAPRPSVASVITLSGAASQAGARVSDAVGSVVLVLTDDGHGSGFLVSTDGYLLTNEHVVGKAKSVVVRWSDGMETSAEVVRIDKRRDVALIKTQSRSRAPLSLRSNMARTGENVFAIGAPLDKRYQGTVTKGVVSASRIFDGLSFVQSDVTVNPGNSGGPLLDETGKVIGIADLAFQPDGIPTGINLFIPIGDALDFLNLKAAPDAAPITNRHTPALSSAP